jgi:hypothetical protein
VFDSLAERGRSAEWPNVLDQVTRWQGLGLVITMLVGGAVYDPVFMGRLGAAAGVRFHFVQGVTLRFPIYLNLITAVLTLLCALGLREPKMRAAHVAPVCEGIEAAETTAWQLVKTAGRWIVKTPEALFVITAGLLIDSVTRLFLTFSSSYFRLIGLPGASFGLIGAALGSLGLVVSPIARRMVAANSIARNYLLLGAAALVSLICAAFRWHYWGVLFIVPLWGGMIALGYVVSYYLNSLVESSQRATVLSFKGVSFNLAYGFISLVFALVLGAVRDGGSPEQAVARGFMFLPVWLVIWGIACAVYFRRDLRRLRARPGA